MRKFFYFGLITLLIISYVFAEDQEDDDVTVTSEDITPTINDDDIAYESPKSDWGNFYFAENFDNSKTFNEKWEKSQAKKDGIDEQIAKYDGYFSLEPPIREKLNGDMGMVLKTKAKHAAIASKLKKPFIFNKDQFIVQYEVTFQDGQECGGAYLKLLSKGALDLKQFHDKTPYTIMFGPDKCGNDMKLHFIFRHVNPKNGSIEEKHLTKKHKERLDEAFNDKLPHLYTLILKPDNTFQIFIDHKLLNDGSLLDDFTPPVNPPAEIDDPNDKKPEDWDEREKIPDETAVKPDDWDETAPQEIPDPNAIKPDGWLDDVSPFISDPSATKPEDWDPEMDGEWEAPQINNPVCENSPGCGEWKPPLVPNPNYKGKWRAPMIPNPNYKGKWRPRRIPNPEFFEDKTPFKMTAIEAVGFELWSMSKDILFDNIIVTDSLENANQYAKLTYDLKRIKIDKSGLTLWGRMMKSINYSPGWWTVYFIYCLIPIVGYIIFLYRRYREESLWTRVWKFTSDNPWIWVVYVLVLGLPVVLALVFCCSSSTKDTAELERQARAKKTDAYTEDDLYDEKVDHNASEQFEARKSYPRDENVSNTDQKCTESDEDDGQEVENDEALSKNTNKISKSNLEEKYDDSDENNIQNDDDANDDLPRKRRIRKD